MIRMIGLTLYIIVCVIIGFIMSILFIEPLINKYQEHKQAKA